MFSNYRVESRIVKKSDTSATSLPELPKFELPSKETVEHVSREMIKNAAIAVIAVIGAAALAKTASDIVVHHATK